MLNRNSIFKALAFLALIALVLTIFFTTSFGFFHLILVFSVLLFWQLSRPVRLETQGNHNRPMDPKFAFSGAGCVLLLLLFCYRALNNYINPDPEVFSNSEHHAVSVDSIKINNPNGYVLAGNSRNAFFDNLDVRESAHAKICDVHDSTLLINLHEITTPIYRYLYDEDECNYRQELIHVTGISSMKGPDLCFTLTNTLGKKLTIFIEEKHERNLFLGYANDSTIYSYEVDGGIRQYATITTFLQKGLPLERIFPEIEGFDLGGITLLRPHIYPIAKRNELYDKLNGEYALSFEEEAISRGNICQADYQGTICHVNQLVSHDCQVILIDGQSVVFGFGENQSMPVTFHLSQSNGSVNMLFRVPVFRTLSTVGDDNLGSNMVYVTSSLADGENVIDPDLPENVLLFNIFRHHDNIHNMRPSYLAFVNGASTERMNFKVMVRDGTIQALVAGQPYPKTTTSCRGEEWCLSIRDFKSETPFSASRICLFLLLTAVLASIALTFGESANSYYKHGGILLFSNLELGAYMMLLIFLTIRLFLLWRLSVFPPSSDISNFEMNSFFRQESLWSWLLSFVIGFFAAVIYFKWCVLHCGEQKWHKWVNALNLFEFLKRWLSLHSKELKISHYHQNYIDPFELARSVQAEKEAASAKELIKESVEDRWKRIKKAPYTFIKDHWSFVAFFILTIGLGLTSILLRSSRLCILIAVAAYFFGDMFLTARLVRGYKEDFDEPDDDFIRQSHFVPLLITTFHLLFWAIVLFIADSGYGIMFLTFGLIWTVLRLREVDLFARGKGHWPIMVLMAIFVVVIAFYKYILLWAVSSKFAFMLVCATLGFSLVFLMMRALLGKERIVTQLVSSVVCALVFALAGIYLSFMIEGEHTEYRIRVHMSDPAEQLAHLPNRSAERHFLEASMNDFVMARYYDEGDNISLIGQHGVGYFKMLPHSKIGAMWGAQASDISLSRFVIAEHGQWLPVALIAVFLLLLCMGLTYPAHSRTAKGIFIQVPLLLFIQSLIIWMAVTRRFIFLGQDFPLISCNSKMTIIYTLFLLFLLVAAIAYDSQFVSARSIDEDESIRRAGRKSTLIFAFFMLAIGAAFSAENIFVRQKSLMNYTMKDALDKASLAYNTPQILVPDSIVDKYKVATTDDESPSYFSLNELIENWQVQRKKQKPDPNHWATDIHDVRRMMQAFDDVYNIYIKSSYQDAGVDPLAFRMYEHYVNNLSSHNNYDNLMHMHRVKSTGKAVLTVNSKYYDSALPRRNKTAWVGSVLEHKPQTAIGNSASGKGYDAQRFPSNWFVNGQDVVVARVKNPSGVLTVASRASDVPLCMEHKNPLKRSVRIFPTDKVSDRNHNVLLVSMLSAPSYLARNIQVNGHRTFVYPMGDTLVWARNFAIEAQAAGNRRMKDKQVEPLGDVPVTLNMQLTRELYTCLNDNVHERAVVVADGDGYVRALVDAKSARYQLDPNDHERLGELTDSMYMVGGQGSRYERMAFGSLALQHLLGGPGSTQKPLVYAAIASGFDLGKCNQFDDWNNLYMDPIQWPATKQSPTSNKFQFPKFAGVKSWKNFRSIPGDEGVSGTTDIKPDAFIYKSSNFYNSMLVYIGSHDVELFSTDNIKDFLRVADSANGSTLFYKEVAASRMDSARYIDTWPIMNNSKDKHMAFNKTPTIDQNRSLLHQRMRMLFDLPGTYKDTTCCVSLYPSLSRHAHVGYVYPEVPYLDVNKRSNANKRNFTQLSIIQTATGQRIVWNVSPLDMAQMFCRLLPGQAHVRLSIDPSQQKAALDDIECANNQHFDRWIKGLYESMSKVYSQEGTVREFSLENALKGANCQKCYWIYGKTGTINQTKGHDDALLVTLITNQDLCGAVDPSTLRYYVIYSVLYKQKGARQKQKEIIECVLNSKVFKEYMEK